MKYLILIMGFITIVVAQSIALEPAPDAITIDQAIEACLKNNLSIKSVNTEAKIKKRDSDFSFNKFYPSASVSATGLRLNEATPTLVGVYNGSNYYYTPDKNNLALGVTIQEVFSPVNFGLIAQSITDYKDSLITRKKTEKALKANVKKLFYQLIVQSESIEVTKSRLQNANERLRQAQVSYDLGQGNELNYTYAKSNVESIIPTLQAMETQRLQALIQFEEILGYEKKEDLVLKGTLPNDGNSPEIILDNKGSRIDVLESQISIEQLEKALKIQDLTLLPNLVFQYKADPTYNNPKSDGMFDSENWHQSSGGLSLTLSWKLDSLLPGSDYWIKRIDLKDRLALAKESATTTAKSAVNDEEIQKRQVKDSLDKIENLKNVVVLSKRAYDLNDAAYKAGGGRFLDLQDAELSSQSAQIQLLSERLNLMTLLCDLEAKYDN